MFKLITDCGLSGMGMFLSLRNIKKSNSAIWILLNVLFICVYLTTTVLSIGLFINKRKTEKDLNIHHFNKYFNK